MKMSLVFSMSYQITFFKQTAHKYPDLASFGFFCRRTNIKYMEKKYSSFIENRYGRGLVLHFTPSNVPMNFAYSLFFALLPVMLI